MLLRYFKSNILRNALPPTLTINVHEHSVKEQIASASHTSVFNCVTGQI